MIGLLRRTALRWAQALSTRQQIGTLTYNELELQLKAIFDRLNYATDATDRLLSIQQGAHTVPEYVIEFWTLAVEAGWNDPPLLGVFRQGLNKQLRDAVALRWRPKDLNSLISLATELDNYFRGQHRDQAPLTPPYPPPPRPLPSGPVLLSLPAVSAVSSTGSEPMQLRRAKLTPSERRKRLGSKACLYCGQTYHLISSCPKCPVLPKE